MVRVRAAADTLAFEQTVRTESRLTYSLALSIRVNRKEAEDAVQDTMELACPRRSVRTVSVRPRMLVDDGTTI